MFRNFGAFIFSKKFPRSKSMSIFTQNLNPITGRMEWIFHNEDYDFKQEIARSAYADMLHDDERNMKYYDGLRSCVKHLRQKGEEIHVLDIGTGTGLLAMMAVKCGVNSVTACEAFGPVAECASTLIKKNGFEDKIKLIGKRSTELSVGDNKDQLARRANLLVTEVFDTELIGEGAIETFSHAREHLLTPDALIVPSKASIYAQVVDSEWVRRWNKILPVLYNTNGDTKELISIPPSISTCSGSAAVWDIQLSQVSKELFSELSDPIEVFKFDWSGRNIGLVKSNSKKNEFVAKHAGSCDAVFMWWDITMDFEEKIKLSCAPFWAHPDFLRSTNESFTIPWRDHWMQAVYFPPKAIDVQKGDCLTLVSSHDEYSLWFNVDKRDEIVETSPKCHGCSCGLHGLVSRSRLGQLGDPTRINLYNRVLSKYVTSDTVGLILGDACMWAVAMARLGARHVYVKESNSITGRILEQFLKSNCVEDRVTILPNDAAELNSCKFVEKINLVFSEPYFSSSLLPWHSILYSYIIESMKDFISESALFLPSNMKIKALPVHYRDLWKIRAPLNECCEFTMSNFDEMIDSASTEADADVEPQPLWEYPAYAMSRETRTLVNISLGMSVPQSLEVAHSIPFSNKHKCDEKEVSSKSECTLNGMSLWCDWEFGSSEEILSTGPQKRVNIYEKIDWDPYVRQGVYLFHEKEELRKNSSKISTISKFDPADGSFKFEFKLNGE